MIFDHNRITVGALTMFLTLIARFYTRLEAMLRMVQSTQRAGSAPSGSSRSSTGRRASPSPPGRFTSTGSKAIELRQVAFRHGSRSILGASTSRFGRAR